MPGGAGGVMGYLFGTPTTRRYCGLFCGSLDPKLYHMSKRLKNYIFKILKNDRFEPFESIILTITFSKIS